MAASSLFPTWKSVVRWQKGTGSSKLCYSSPYCVQLTPIPFAVVLLSFPSFFNLLSPKRSTLFRMLSIGFNVLKMCAEIC